MKKLFIIIFCLFLTGCSKNFTFNDEKAKKIMLNDMVIMPDSHDEILTYLRNIMWKKSEFNLDFNNILRIVTDSAIYDFYIDGDNVYYKLDDCLYESDSSNHEFVYFLSDLRKKYLDNDFYSIRYVENYISNSDDFLIKIGSGKDYFIIESDLDINKFRIHELEKNSNEFLDVNVLYQDDTIPANQRIVIRTDNSKYENIRITFLTPYDYRISIIPIFDDLSGEFIYKSEFSPK